MWRRVVWYIDTVLSEKPAASVFRVQFTLQMKAPDFSNTLELIHRSTNCHNPEGHSHMNNEFHNRTTQLSVQHIPVTLQTQLQVSCQKQEEAYSYSSVHYVRTIAISRDFRLAPPYK
jgi:hypothetical protein